MVLAASRRRSMTLGKLRSRVGPEILLIDVDARALGGEPPEDDCGDSNCGGDVVGALVVASGDAPPILERVA